MRIASVRKQEREVSPLSPYIQTQGAIRMQAVPGHGAPRGI